MSGVATAIAGSALIGAIVSNKAAGKAADASREGAELSAEGQREALEYLKEVEKLPRELREGALKKLGGLYGLEGGEGSQQEMIDFAEGSPLYEAMVGTREAGEESIMRNAAATGGLRSGNVQNAMYDYNQRLNERALLESYNQQVSGLSGLSGLPSYASEIAGVTTGIGETMGQGAIAAGQARQQGYQGVGDAVSGGVNNMMMAKYMGLI